MEDTAYGMLTPNENIAIEKVQREKVQSEKRRFARA